MTNRKIYRKSKTIGTKCEKDETSESWEIQSYVGVTVYDKLLELVDLFKYPGSMQSVDGNNDNRSRIGKAKKTMLDLNWDWYSALVGVYGCHR